MVRERLEEINFTEREMDVIACILKGRGAKKISLLLKISPKTAEVHLRNIMSKLGCNSKESIIDYVEKSSLRSLINQRYYKISEIPGEDNNTEFKDPAEIKASADMFKTAKFKDPLNFAYGHTKLSSSLYNKIFINLGLYPSITLFKITSLGVIAICLAMIIINFFNSSSRNNYSAKPEKQSSTRSEIVLPQDSYLLERTALINKIKKNFKSQKSIKTVVLLGVCGAGKTTIARQYVISQDAPVVWEINAEKKDTLILSFEKLAYVLAQTEEDKSALKEIAAVNDCNQREEKLFMYIKNKLLSKPNWILIYDNVENFYDIQDYFPYDAKVWGEGNVLITTSNNMISNNSCIGSNNVIKVGELNKEEKIKLFNKIIYSSGVDLSLKKEQEFDSFEEGYVMLSV